MRNLLDAIETAIGGSETDEEAQKEPWHEFLKRATRLVEDKLAGVGEEEGVAHNLEETAIALGEQLDTAPPAQMVLDLCSPQMTPTTAHQGQCKEEAGTAP